jgi:hypothetical protein
MRDDGFAMIIRDEELTDPSSFLIAFDSSHKKYKKETRQITTAN